MIPQEVSSIFEPIAEKAEKKITGPKLDEIPFPIGPMQYAGLGDFQPEIPKIKPDLLSFKPTPPTMEIQPVFDIITGKIVDYKDLPVSTLSTDNPDLVKPVTDIDNYLSGKGSFAPNHFDERDFSKYLAALETGANLLTTPFSDEKADANDALEEMVDLPPIQASDVYKQKKPEEEEEFDMPPAVVDSWDVSLFREEVPNPAIDFKFKCDDFQVRSMRRLERNEMVFVSAPTSAGKTVVAQYGIALAKQHKMRAIYTSPIKALSNQKFRDFSRQFGDVGILTGDVSLNRDASVLIMTTEILRSMLYRGADLLRDVDIVIFDEVHYINDQERGVVWEESIILMPPHINMVFLSATIPNDMEIASWIGRTKRRQVFIERHTTRPVPLVHCVFSNYDVTVLQEPGKAFNHGSYKKIKDKFEEKMKNAKCKKPLMTPKFWENVARTLKKRDMLPCLMFSFSQKNCEKFADFVEKVPDLKLVEPKQVSHIESFFRKSIARLKPSDRNLPQVELVHKFLIKGIGIHHGGMLPILKECVEILLADGYVQMLFCTSTFAMGINVPARSCAFTSLTKFNGKEMVDLTPTEYVQMSGRAGRRGLDDKGYAILIVSDKMPEEQYLQKTFSGKVEQLNSKFHIRFNMVLNILRTQGIKMIDIMKRSLSANKLESQVPKLKKDYDAMEDLVKKFQPPECVLQEEVNKFDMSGLNLDIEDLTDASSTFSNIVFELSNIQKKIWNLLGKSDTMKYIQPGQVVLTSEFYTDIAFVTEKKNGMFKLVSKTGSSCDASLEKIIAIFDKKVNTKKGGMLLNSIEGLSINDLTYIPFKDIIKSKDADFIQFSNQHEKVFNVLIKHPCFSCPSRAAHIGKGLEHFKNVQRLKSIEKEINDNQAAYMPLLNSRLNLLKDNGYITEDETILMKGRLSIEIGTCNELIATELLCSNFFDDLEPAEIAALCSVLVTQRAGDSKEEIELLPNLEEKVICMRNVAQEIADAMDQFQIDYDEDFVQYNVNPAASTPVYRWAQGLDFIDVMKESSIPEGALVRIILMTNELLRSFSTASKLIGNVKLVQKFDDASETIKRDIIFASSLYFD